MLRKELISRGFENSVTYLKRYVDEKLIIYNCPPSIVYPLINSFLTKVDPKYDYPLDCYYRGIAFYYDKESFYKDEMLFEIKKFLDTNFFICHIVSQKDMADSIIGFENLLIMDNLTNAPLKDLMKQMEFIKTLSKNVQRMYYSLPEVCYGDSLQPLDADQPPNNPFEIAGIHGLKTYDCLMQYLKIVDKMPLYRFVMPQLVPTNCFFNNNGFSVGRFRKYHRQFLDTKFSFMSEDKVAELIHLFYNNMKPMNYGMTDYINNKISITELYRKISLKDEEGKSDRVCNFTHSDIVADSGFKNHSRRYYKQFVLRNQPAKE